MNSWTLTNRHKTRSSATPRAVVIGAGIGGLTAAALLARAGLAVTVLEAHIYPGGCAGTFYHQGYRFDAGATVAGGFYAGGPMHQLAAKLDISEWRANPTSLAMATHMPLTRKCSSQAGASDAGRKEQPVLRFADERRWQEHARAFGSDSLAFWHWQERTADLFWNLALRLPPWPPQSPQELSRLIVTGGRWALAHLPQLVRPSIMQEAFSPLAARLHHAPENLRLFLDGQLLIAAQATSHSANALYAAAALDLPRRGIVHFEGGMGTLAQQLVETVRRFGGEVHFRTQVTEIRMNARSGNQGPVAVATKHKEIFDADVIIANLTPWNIRTLIKPDHYPRALAGLPHHPERGWGAFMVYAGIDESALKDIGPLHHQVLVQEPLGEGNSIFVSISPKEDATRAPQGKRALTISTHTSMRSWWELRTENSQRYEQRREAYTRRVLMAAERAVPGISAAAELVLPGTPVTFNRFTRRARGWVGGFPQTSLLTAWGPRLGQNLWMVGDSIFPGQSTAAVALGGMRVAQSILSEMGYD